MKQKKNKTTQINSNGRRTELEKNLLKMMIDFDVDQTELARHEGVTPQAINNRLKRLNREKFERFKSLIKKIGSSRE